MNNGLKIALTVGVVGGALCLALPGCSLFTGASATPQQVAAAENGFIAADGLAMAYMTLPPCGVPKPTSGVAAVCSDPAVKAVIKAKEQVAYTAFQTFQSATASGSSADMAALDAAIAAMVNAIPAVASAPVPAK